MGSTWIVLTVEFGLELLTVRTCFKLLWDLYVKFFSSSANITTFVTFYIYFLHLLLFFTFVTFHIYLTHTLQFIYIYISLLICLTGNTIPWMPSGDSSIFCNLPLSIFIMSSMVILIGAKYLSG